MMRKYGPGAGLNPQPLMDPSGVLCHLATLPGLFEAIYDCYLFDDTTGCIPPRQKMQKIYSVY